MSAIFGFSLAFFRYFRPLPLLAWPGDKGLGLHSAREALCSANSSKAAAAEEATNHGETSTGKGAKVKT